LKTRFLLEAIKTTDYEKIVREIIKMKNTTPEGIVLEPNVVFEYRELDFKLLDPKYRVGHPSQIREAFQELIKKTIEEK